MLTWHEAEWDAAAFMAYSGGYEVSVSPPREGEPQWFWTVDATSEISEWPETWSCGFASSEAGAKAAAQISVEKAIAHHRPKPEPEGKMVWIGGERVRGSRCEDAPCCGCCGPGGDDSDQWY